MSGLTKVWLEEHLNYPHDAWCLVWPFCRDPYVGRGMVDKRIAGTRWAHRVMCEMVHGPAPEGRPHAAHRCGNGHLGCVNPKHLFWATVTENQLQRYADGRVNKNANGNKSRYTPEQIEEMRSLYGLMTIVDIAKRFDCSQGTVQYYLKYRDRRGHGAGKIDHWSPDEDDQLAKALADGLRHEDIAKLIGRSHESVSARASRLRLKSRRGSGGLLLPLAS